MSNLNGKQIRLYILAESDDYGGHVAALRYARQDMKNGEPVIIATADVLKRMFPNDLIVNEYRMVDETPTEPPHDL